MANTGDQHGNSGQLTQALREICSRFLNLEETLIKELGIVTIIAGGSLVYQHAINGTVSNARDFDGAMIIQTVEDLGVLLNENREQLRRLPSIASEECPNMPVSSATSSEWKFIDGVRYSGVSQTGLEKSIKILVAEHFFSNRRCINLLSYKDKRVYEGTTLTGQNAVRVQPATRLPSGLTVLHDPWLFRAPSHDDGPETIRASFGITADLIITGAWLHGDSIGRAIRGKLLAHAQQVIPALRSYHFTRSSRFHPRYTKLLSANLGVVVASKQEGGDDTLAAQFLYGDVKTERKPMPDQWPGTVNCLANNTIFRKTKDGQLDFESVEVLRSPFTNNAENSIATVRIVQQDGDNERHTVFCKRAVSSQQLSECQGALQAARYYPLVQQPLADCDWMLYPYSKGTTVAELQS